ncbi:MAG: S1/P1 nuclease [Alistipes sp.]|nr:S1/P1 nuclease [Alistipes sp.]
MKKILTLVTLILLFTQSVFAWGRLGHTTIVEIAKNHLTEKAKANIAKYMPYDLKKDALWMDYHRKDKEIAYTTSWHVYNVDENGEYDPNPRLYKGDAIFALKTAEYNLAHYERLTDSAVVMNLRMALHFVGDMHCPTHSYVPGPRCFWPCKLNGKKIKTFHGLYDGIPERLYGKKSTPEEVAAKLDNCKKGEIKRIQRGTLYDWARDCGTRNRVIYDINPHNTVDLDPQTVEKSSDLIDIQIRNAGYRLAAFLNRYFDK